MRVTTWPEGPVVRLPAEGSSNEGLHCAAWVDLLAHPHQPGSSEHAALGSSYLADLCQAATRTRAQERHGESNRSLRSLLQDADADAFNLHNGARVETVGQCNSDLFVRCSTCRHDRMVVEVKGPRARLNRGKSKGQWRAGFQTEEYVDAYRGSERGCGCNGGSGTPTFLFLDARSRSRDKIEEDETDFIGSPMLGTWIVLGYEQVLRAAPFRAHPLAQWLLKPASTRAR
jgi:hypothetical protein